MSEKQFKGLCIGGKWAGRVVSATYHKLECLEHVSGTPYAPAYASWSAVPDREAKHYVQRTYFYNELDVLGDTYRVWLHESICPSGPFGVKDLLNIALGQYAIEAAAARAKR